MIRTRRGPIFAARRSPAAAIDGGLTAATFLAGSLGALLLLDAHEGLGIGCALVALALRIVHTRYLRHRARSVRGETADAL